MKAKKFISAVCAFAMAATSAASLVSAAGEQVIIKGDQIEKEAGASFELSFSLDKFSGIGFSGCEFAIQYDPSLITNVKVKEGSVLSTGASKAEVDKNSSIASSVVMVNKGEYNCFDYNIKEGDKLNTIAVLWCTGLDDDKYWAKDTGSLVSITGTVAKGVEAGTKIPVNVVAIPREGNKEMVFGYADGSKDVTYTSAVEQQGQITVVEATSEDKKYEDYTPLWGDVDDNGTVSATDIVAMMQANVSMKDANLTKQGIVNGNMDQSDGDRDFDSDSILGPLDFKALKKYILRDYTADKFPIK